MSVRRPLSSVGRRSALTSLLAIALATSAAAGASSTGPSGTSGRATGASGVSGPTSPPAPPPRSVRYRAVGCRVRGPVTAYRSGPDRLVAALSFDDGPSIDTAAFVAMLKANRVPGTFFEIGDQIAPAYFKTMRTMLRDGDAIGDHTFTHPKLVDSDDVATQLAATITAIRSATGYTPCVFRPPYGLYNASIEATARALGLATIMWNVDPSDYLQPGVQVIEQRVLEEVQPGSIIISHDGGGPRAQTLAAYPYIIAALRKRGYHFETVPRLLGFHTIYRRCTTRCRGEGVRAPPPKGSIVEPPD